MASFQLEANNTDLYEAIQSRIELCSDLNLEDVYIAIITFLELAIGIFLLRFFARILINLLNSAWKLLTALFYKLTALFCKFTSPSTDNIGHAKEAPTPSKRWNTLINRFVLKVKETGLSMSKEIAKTEGRVGWKVRRTLIQGELEDALQRAMKELLDDAAKEWDFDAE